MKFAADLHVHSRFARAVSERMTLSNMAGWAERKGVKVLGTGDFTHPQWFSKIRNDLEEAEPGLFRLKKRKSKTRFLLSSEVSCIYSKKGRVRKIHLVVLAPSFKAVEGVNLRLARIGNLKADGRPILGIDVQELVKIILEICPECMIISAHVWTPWFSLFGSKSGFDSLEECFGKQVKGIKAVETGLSSDPAMNWRLSELDDLSLVSNSDAHSPEKIGREANFLETELSYEGVVKALDREKEGGILFTVEFYPEEGKYHFDGHRKCEIRFSPEETRKSGGICPVCGKPLTVGVLHRVEELADRPAGEKPEGAVPFKKLVPLEEIIAEVEDVGVRTKTVKRKYDKLLKSLESELDILLDVSKRRIEKTGGPRLAEAVLRVRRGEVSVWPGYDGTYGEVRIFEKGERKSFSKQKNLFS